MRYLSTILLLAFAYFVAAKFGSLFTVPPYAAAVVWPGAGIALGVLITAGNRYWPGVLLGAVAVNLQHSPVIDFSSIVISSIIAIGAVLQALVGSYLCKRMVRFPNPLEEAPQLLAVFLLGGVVACVISASVGTATLYFFGIVSGADFAGHWYFWWLGDVSGVVAFAPVTLLLLATPIKNFPISLARKWLVSWVVVFSFFAIGIMFMLAQRVYQADKQANFDNAVAGVERELVLLLSTYHNVLQANDQFFLASNFVSADEFSTFTEKFFELYPGLYALNWTPRVIGDQRAQHEEAVRRQGFPNYRILDRIARGEMGEAPERELYFPIAYIAPYERNKGAHGFDVYGPDPLAPDVRKNLLDLARIDDVARSTGKISIVQAENRAGLLVYHPIFSISKTGAKALLGYTAGVFVIPVMFDEIRQRAQAVDAEFVLFDTAGEEPRFLYDSRAPEAQEISQPLSQYKGLQLARDTEFGQRGMQMVFVQSDATVKQFNWLLAGASAGLLLIMGMISLLLFTMSARADVVTRLVKVKTRELEEANAELEEFAYRTSHDLRSPLVSSIGLLKYIGKEIPEGNARLTQSVSIVRSSLVKLEALVTDILSLTKTKNVTEALTEVDVNAVVDDSLQKFAFMDGYSGITFEKKLKCVVSPKVQSDKFVQVVENLISNAIKYRDPAKSPSNVTISTYEQSERFVFEVSDNGMGVPKDKQSDLFTMFNRFHPRVSFGSGLGLYMVQKSVQAMGGEIEFEDLGGGSLFRVTLPLTYE